jgi:uncharacterized Zn finger protein
MQSLCRTAPFKCDLLGGLWQRINTAFQREIKAYQGTVEDFRDTGMFPAPREIKFSCSCPDWANMCKHVAAALYGVGARLDEDPKLFFRLRDADISTLITQTVTDKTKKLLEKADRKSSRIMEDTDLSAVFGIDIDEPHFSIGLIPVKPPPARKKRKTAATSPQRKPSLKMGTKKSDAGKAKKKIDERSPSKKAKTKTTVVKKRATKAGRKSTGKNVRKKRKQY